MSDKLALTTQAMLDDPAPFYRAALTTCPVMLLDDGITYLVTSHALVAEATTRTGDFSNDFSALLEGVRADDPEVRAILKTGWPQLPVLLMADPPAHSRHRAFVGLAFSLKRVDAIEPRIRAIVTPLIDAIMPGKTTEFMAAVASKLPVAVIAGQLGLGPDDTAMVRRWTDAFTDRLGGMISREREIECAREVVDFQHRMMVNIVARRGERYDDLLGDIVAAAIEGETPLADAELLSIIQQLVVAGSEATASTLGEAMLLFAQHPSQYARLRADPALLPNAVEEIIRLASPSSGGWRIVTRDTELGGVAIPRGARLMLRFAAANRDGARFSEPDGFDIGRANARTHLGFGRGIHSCIGNMLARREVSVALQALVARFSRVTLMDDPAALVYPPNILLRGVAALPLRFDP